MKNLLIYINPAKAFFGGERNLTRNCTPLVKIQIDNSLELGWSRKDIVLVTNFAYEYNGIKSIVVDENNFCCFRPLSTKTITVANLLEKGMLEKNELYWVHDFDAFQVNRFQEGSLGLSPNKIGLTDYGWSSKWCMGSIFFTTAAKDVFSWIKNTILELQTEDERALSHLVNNNIHNIRDRVQKINITYNFGMRRVEHNYTIAKKPLKVVHFHPTYALKDKSLTDTPLNIFMYGKNKLEKPLMSKRLIKIFNTHGIK